jgi:hypothetical protein
MFMEQTESSRPSFLWRLFAAVLAPVVIVSADLLRAQWLYHGSGSHNTAPSFIIGIAVGGWFVLTLPIWRAARIVCLLLYIPLTWALLIPYSLWFIAVFFHGMVSGG